MILFIVILTALCTTMLLLGIGTSIGKRSVKLTCGRADQCCRNPRDALSVELSERR
jgi:hypothetical protein